MLLFIRFSISRNGKCNRKWKTEFLSIVTEENIPKESVFLQYLSKIPPPILQNIINYLNIKEKRNFRLCNKSLQQLLDEHILMVQLDLNKWNRMIYGEHEGEREFNDEQLLDLISKYPKVNSIVYLHQCNDSLLKNLSRWHLTHLNIGLARITKRGLTWLPNLLTNLDLFGCSQIEDEHLSLLPHSLTSLNLSLCGISGNGIKHLQKIPLKELFLSDILGTNKTPISLSTLPSSLHRLDLWRSSYKNDTEEEFPFPSNLKTLRLSSVDNKKLTLPALPKKLVFFHFSLFFMENNLFSRIPPSLKYLKLSDSHIRNGIHYLPSPLETTELHKKLLNFSLLPPNLKIFEIFSYYKLTPEDISQLSSSLEVITFENTNFTDKLMQFMHRTGPLWGLGLEGCKELTNECLRSFPLKLKHVNLSGCKNILALPPNEDSEKFTYLWDNLDSSWNGISTIFPDFEKYFGS